MAIVVVEAAAVVVGLHVLGKELVVLWSELLHLLMADHLTDLLVADLTGAAAVLETCVKRQPFKKLSRHSRTAALILAMLLPLLWLLLLPLLRLLLLPLLRLLLLLLLLLVLLLLLMRAPLHPQCFPVCFPVLALLQEVFMLLLAPAVLIEWCTWATAQTICARASACCEALETSPLHAGCKHCSSAVSHVCVSHFCLFQRYLYVVSSTLLFNIFHGTPGSFLWPRASDSNNKQRDWSLIVALPVIRPRQIWKGGLKWVSSRRPFCFESRSGATGASYLWRWVRFLLSMASELRCTFAFGCCLARSRCLN